MKEFQSFKLCFDEDREHEAKASDTLWEIKHALESTDDGLSNFQTLNEIRNIIHFGWDCYIFDKEK
jgi:hypothetical protein